MLYCTSYLTCIIYFKRYIRFTGYEESLLDLLKRGAEMEAEILTVFRQINAPA